MCFVVEQPLSECAVSVFSHLVVVCMLSTVFVCVCVCLCVCVHRDSLWLCLLNSGTSFVSGFAVFSALGFMAHQQGIPINMVVDSGPGLAFIAFPQAVAMMPLPQLWATCFFLMLILLGLDTLFVGLETITSTVIDMFPGQLRRPWRREIFLIIFCSISFIIQIS
ncbi:sodium- and chloride-dependent GABA transporter 3-like, partial [Plectropomus leopardus]|uniref:sodium- and chloride-dependent GABA transporter 3-like n=1 Tax=Plectropomus leopardus TaxID=160734 RepID=UPI001C4A82AF